ncbi:MAG: hypothetical protein QY323_04235 [Patescibacteria group bacterium]|nr:MAG: hypothetical protein QY323_04235 [Patescibacteria group bacterium]
MRLRRKQVIAERHTEFSPLLFDVLFGLLVFLGIDALFDLKGPQAFLFVVTSIAIIVHWWLKYKTADETYGLDVGNSTLDLLFGLIEIVLLQLAIIAASRGAVIHAVFYFSLPLLTESVWALLWRFCGSWRRSTKDRVKFMEQQLETTLFLNLGTAAAIGALLSNAALLSTAEFIGVFAVLYALYALLSSYWELVDVKLM